MSLLMAEDFFQLMVVYVNMHAAQNTNVLVCRTCARHPGMGLHNSFFVGKMGLHNSLLMGGRRA